MILANSNVPHRNSCLSLFSVINGGCSKAFYILYILSCIQTRKKLVELVESLAVSVPLLQSDSELAGLAANRIRRRGPKSQ